MQYAVFLTFLPSRVICELAGMSERNVDRCAHENTQMHFNSSFMDAVHMNLCLYLQIGTALDHFGGHLSNKARCISPNDPLQAHLF